MRIIKWYFSHAVMTELNICVFNICSHNQNAPFLEETAQHNISCILIFLILVRKICYLDFCFIYLHFNFIYSVTNICGASALCQTLFRHYRYDKGQRKVPVTHGILCSENIQVFCSTSLFSHIQLSIIHTHLRCLIDTTEPINVSNTEFIIFQPSSLLYFF